MGIRFFHFVARRAKRFFAAPLLRRFCGHRAEGACQLPANYPRMASPTQLGEHVRTLATVSRKRNDKTDREGWALEQAPAPWVHKRETARQAVTGGCPSRGVRPPDDGSYSWRPVKAACTRDASRAIPRTIESRSLAMEYLTVWITVSSDVAGVAQWQSTWFPTKIRGFDSLRPLLLPLFIASWTQRGRATA